MPPRPRPPRHVPTGTLPRRAGRSWWELSASALGHLLLLLLIAGLFNTPDTDDPDEPQASPTPEPPTQQMPIYIPPPPQPQPQTPPPPAPPPQPRAILPSTPEASRTPAPPASSAPKEENPNAPPEEQKRTGQREPDDAGTPETTPNKAAPKPTTPAPATTTRVPTPQELAAAEQAAEAQRLFGTKRRADATNDPITVRPFAAGPDGKPQQCEPLPRFERDAEGKAPIGVAVGRILREDGVTPLSGALLQMVGTPFVAFTDDNGEYKFRYDMSLIEDCRTQYVRVSAKGYESRLLVLVIGERVRSEDVALRRNSGLPFRVRPGS